MPILSKSLLLLAAASRPVVAFEFKLPSFAAPSPKELMSTPNVQQKKTALLDAVSGTNNGKTASPTQQTAVLNLVRQLETEAPAPDDILTDQAAKIDGTWYLQYTSPSDIDGEDDEDGSDDVWKPVFAKEGDSNIETKQFQAKGSVSAAGIPVDTSNRVVKQILNVQEARVTNDIGLDWGRIVVGGGFRPSEQVPNRAVVAFDTAEITIGGNTKLSLGWLFGVIGTVRGSKDNGWLETTYIDDDMRIGRGNKGTLFVLTRTPDAVSP